MAERHELLDQAIEAIIAGATEVAIPRDLEALVALAADLCDLPDPEFKRKLGGRMTATATTVRLFDVTPYIVVEDADTLIKFVKRVFGAKQVLRTTGSAGGTHCELRVGDTKLMIGGNIKLTHPPNLGALHVFVRDVDEVYHRAIKAGATPLGELVDQPYGSREGSVRDTFGNHWYIATERGAKYRPEGTRDLMPYFHPVGAPKMIEFLEAIGAEVTQKYEEGGHIAHAKVRAGDAILELGEAHGQWQPIPMMLLAIVDDADAAYERAVAAGAKPLSPPKDLGHGYGGSVEDAWGDQWHLMKKR